MNCEKWVYDYLNSEGNNPDLAAGIAYHARFFIGPLETELHRLRRIAGPDKIYLYTADKDVWEQTINAFAERILGGELPPPLIAVDFLENVRGLAIADGNKRYEALKRAGFVKYPTVFCLALNPVLYNLVP